MASIKSKNTKPEIKIRKSLFKMGFRYRINDKKLIGSPDIVLTKYKTVIFVHGCYWHGHENCTKSIKPATNKEFWKDKIRRNKKRDKMVEETLSSDGWKVIVIWECELRNQEMLIKTVTKIAVEIKPGLKDSSELYKEFKGTKAQQ